ncbi:MAG: PQQ-binding-like beta-propeller repeat protein [Planctomycetota bacterium]|nr:PQQ-binding-like beta-propeller repeat protein [Planctomycetota bacterium]
MKHLLWLAVGVLAGCPGSSGRPVQEKSPADVQAIARAADIRSADSDWPWWRGADRNGHALAGLAFEPTKISDHLRWRSPVPGRGHASPVVWGNKIFVATADEAQQTQALFCFDRDGGSQLWNTELHRGGFMKKHNKNSHASATPACDGQHVFCVSMIQQALWATAVDMDGKIVWQKRLGDFRPKHGYGSSPVLYKSLVIVAGDNRGPGYLVALDRDSGEVVWRKGRPAGDSYGTPVIAKVAGREQLLLSGREQVASYDPASGRLLWRCEGISSVTANTMAWHEDLVLGSTGYPDNVVMCVRADGSGDVSATHVMWKKNFRMYVASAVVVDDLFLIVRDDGVALVLEPATGKSVWQKRLGGAFSASPTAAGDTVYVPNEEGRLFLLTASAPFRILGSHDLGEAVFASPVICDGQLFVRGEHHLFCFGPPRAAAAVSNDHG